MSKYIGMTVAFEGEAGEDSVAFKGKITKETKRRFYVEVKGKHKGESGWVNKSTLENNL